MSSLLVEGSARYSGARGKGFGLLVSRSTSEEGDGSVEEADSEVELAKIDLLMNCGKVQSRLLVGADPIEVGSEGDEALSDSIGAFELAGVIQARFEDTVSLVGVELLDDGGKKGGKEWRRNAVVAAGKFLLFGSS